MLNYYAYHLYHRLGLGRYGVANTTPEVMRILESSVVNPEQQQIVPYVPSTEPSMEEIEEAEEEEGVEESTPDLMKNSSLAQHYVHTSLNLVEGLLGDLAKNLREIPSPEGDFEALAIAQEVMTNEELFALGDFVDVLKKFVDTVYEGVIPFEVPTPENNNIEDLARRFLYAMQKAELLTDNEYVDQMSKFRAVLEMRGRMQHELDEKNEEISDIRKFMVSNAGRPLGIAASAEEASLVFPEKYITEEEVGAESDDEEEEEEEKVFEEREKDPWKNVKRSDDPEKVYKRFKEYYRKQKWTDVEINKEFIRYFKNFSRRTKESGDNNVLWINFKKNLGKKTNKIISKDRAIERKEKKSGNLSNKEIRELVKNYVVRLPPMIPIPKPNEDMDPEDFYAKVLDKLGGDYKLTLAQSDKYFLEHTQGFVKGEWKRFRKFIQDDLEDQIYKELKKSRRR
jgi:hypothetical protein